ncbi:MAG: hypothetical protein QXQ86_02255 [Sulfolobales archaeon]
MVKLELRFPYEKEYLSFIPPAPWYAIGPTLGDDIFPSYRREG